MDTLSKNFSVFSLCLLVALLGGCGKHETTGSVMGTATGGIIGAAVAKKNGERPVTTDNNF